MDGRAVYVVEAVPDPELGSGYSRIVSYFDQEYCVPLKMEFYEDSGALRKIMTADPEKVTREEKIWLPRSIVLRDLDRQTESQLLVLEAKIDAGIPDRRFSQSQLGKRH